MTTVPAYRGRLADYERIEESVLAENRLPTPAQKVARGWPIPLRSLLSSFVVGLLDPTHEPQNLPHSGRACYRVRSFCTPVRR